VAGLSPAVTLPAIPPASREPLFFFGTLMDPEVLAAVTGVAPAAAAMAPARLGGFTRRAARGLPWPVLVADPAGSVDGRLWHGADGRARERINAFEAGEYAAALLTVEAMGWAGRAWVWLALPGRVEPSAEPWDPGRWADAHKAGLLAQLGPPG
jgi:hypothetical protein